MFEQQQLDALPLSLDGVKLRIRYSSFPGSAFSSVMPHIHSCCELYVNLSGDVSFLVGGRLVPIAPGDAVLTAPGDVHLCVPHSEKVHTHYCMWVDAPADSPITAAFRREGMPGMLSYRGEAQRQLFDLLRTLWERSGSEDVLGQTASLLELMSFLSADQPGKLRASAEIPGKLQAVLEYIEANYASIRSVGDLAAATYTSPATLTRWFRESLHLSPHAYLEAKKLSAGKKLLAGGATVTEAALEAGFSDVSHFISVFRCRFGVTPLQYQKHGGI